MVKELSINLCDIITFSKKNSLSFLLETEDSIMMEIEKNKGMDSRVRNRESVIQDSTSFFNSKIAFQSIIGDSERYFVGSYFCSNFFLTLNLEGLTEFFKMCQKKESKVTIVVPILTEKNLKYGKEKLRALLSLMGEICDEITVNDYGMLEHVSLLQKKINIGRLMCKDYRDPRHEDFFAASYTSRVFTDYLKDIFGKYNIKSCELELTHTEVIVERIDKEILVAYHSPYSYMTTGQICEFASIETPEEKKFRANSKCAHRCTDMAISYDFLMDKEWRKIGRTLFFSNEDCKLITLNKTREIYFPMKELL